MSRVIVFDGACNLCHGAVMFVIRRDPDRQFRFVAAQSKLGETLMARHGVNALQDETVLLIENESCYLRSEAALRIAAQLHGPWSWFGGLRVLPKFLRDGCYGLIARRRFRLFGRRDTCSVPAYNDEWRFPVEECSQEPAHENS